MDKLIDSLHAAFYEKQIIPYLGNGMMSLTSGYDVPATPEALVAYLTGKVTVPHKIRNKLTQSAQFIENFKHRKTIIHFMNEAYTGTPKFSTFHQLLADSTPPLIVDTWYDDAMMTALAGSRSDWGQVQGLSQSEHFGTWTGWYDSKGETATEVSPDWKTILYKPIGGHGPASNYLVSDTDYVEVLTEIDIQTPIPTEIQNIRTGRSFLFLGCRFNDQLTRSFARQIMKRSSTAHWAVLPEEPTRMELKFMEEQNITRIPMSLKDFADQFVSSVMA